MKWFAAVLLLAPLAGLLAQADSAGRSMNQPVAPFRLVGNVYYVGASDVTSFLIRTSDGMILIDGGFVETVPQILANIRTLGFNPRDIRILLNTHAHSDHAGGLAEFKRTTGARLEAGAGDSALLARGGRADPFLADRYLFPPVRVDRAIRDGDSVTLGGVTLRAIATPGHTAGCTTWQMTVSEAGKSYSALVLCSLWVGVAARPADPVYRAAIETLRHSVARLRQVQCDVPLAAHGSLFGLSEKMAQLRSGNDPLAFVDPAGRKVFLDGAAANLPR